MNSLECGVRSEELQDSDTQAVYRTNGLSEKKKKKFDRER